jgi:hypothetical protein
MKDKNLLKIKPSQWLPKVPIIKVSYDLFLVKPLGFIELKTRKKLLKIP